MRSIRKLEVHRYTPLVLKSLHSCKEDIDAYNFPQESDLTFDFSDSESDYGADSTTALEMLGLAEG